MATITLKREPLNVLNIAMMKEINQALDSLKGQSFKLLLFKAAGKAFSAGVDVGEHLGDQVNEMIEVFHGIFRRMDRLPAVSIASVQGAALGGGCELALYCDLVIASEKAKFGQPEIQVGVFPPIAALIMPRLTARKKALELVLSGDIIPAQEALSLGLINKVVPAEALEEELQKFLGKFSGLSGLVMALTKKAFNAGTDGSGRPGAGGHRKDLFAGDDEDPRRGGGAQGLPGEEEAGLAGTVNHKSEIRSTKSIQKSK